MGNFSSFFNPTPMEKPVFSSDEYRPSCHDPKCVGGIYESIIRFIPYFADCSKSCVKKFVTWVKDPYIQGKAGGKFVDNPKSVGDYSEISEMFSRFWQTNSVQMQDIVKRCLSTKEQYASIIQVIQDKQHPEYVGKFMIFVYGKKIWQKLYEEEHSNPPEGSGISPFHASRGRYFYLKCSAQGQFNNFEKSAFYNMTDPQTGQIIPPGFIYKDAAGNQLKVMDDSDPEVIGQYLSTPGVCPDLSKYEYHPMNAEDQAFVNDVLAKLAAILQNGGVAPMQQMQPQAGYAQGNPQGMFQPQAAPVFPGATIQPQMQMPQQPAYQPQGAPAFPGSVPPVPQMQQSYVQPQMPQQPAYQPQAQPQNMAAPQPQAGGFSMGSNSFAGAAPQSQNMAAPQPQAGMVMGAEAPIPAPADAGVQQPAPSGGIQGNLDDVLAQL